MKRLIIASFILISLFACDKENTQPEIDYLDYIIAGNTEGSGIKYSGIINDTLLFYYPSSGTNRYIDINNDGINDFELKFSGHASPAHVHSENTILTIGNSFIALPEFESYVVDTIPINDTIDDKLNWVNDTCILYNQHRDEFGNSLNTGLWNDVRINFIGTKILVEDKVLFGWIRVEITSGWNMTLIDYACTVELKQQLKLT